MNKDQFGYYLVGNYKTYSKIDALEHAHLFNTPVKWIFNDDVFSTHPWHIDTQEDIKKLYKKRAEQIREKYDYIVVWYSGGADSFTVVNSFRENNIHVDEIAQYHEYEGEKDWHGYLNTEVKHVAIPQTQEFLKSMPHTKHRLVDLTPIIKSMYKQEDNQLDFIYLANKSFGPGQLARTYLREKISDWAKIIASGKKLCFVWGCDLPPVNYDMRNDTYYLQFKDIIDGAGVGPRTQILNRPQEHDELFYWSPDAMELMSRQAHIIVNYMRNPPPHEIDSIYLTRNPWESRFGPDGKYLQYRTQNRTSIKIDNKIHYLTVAGLNRLVYPDWKPDTFSLGKNIGYIFGPRDRWWWQAHRNKDQVMFKSAFESYFKKFTHWGFSNFKGKQELLKPSASADNNFITQKILYDLAGNKKESKVLPVHKKYLLDRYKSKIGYVNDFRNINLDTCYSKKYYLES